MNIKNWFNKRGIGFIVKRAKKLSERYSLDPNKSYSRIVSTMEELKRYGCSPTFAVPGMVIERNSAIILRLQAAGAEIAVHGYNHIDLKACPPHDASLQLQQAAAVFRKHGFAYYGFRCPYLSASDELLSALPQGIFEYSSNKAIQWPVNFAPSKPEIDMFNTIRSFYAPATADSALSIPWFQDGLVEIPVCVPDDLQMRDGLGYDLPEITRTWIEILHHTHQRGEVFNLMFHPELASFCEAPFSAVLKEAISLHPKVWIARLQEVSAWWKEKGTFHVDVESLENQSSLTFHCTPRATIVCRGMDLGENTSPWDSDYSRLITKQITMKDHNLPLIGLVSDVPDWVTKTLTGMGYILVTGHAARQCSTVVDHAWLRDVTNPVELVSQIENMKTPLIRFWPWPDGMRSALCITGDLDALSLIDYAMRLTKR